MSRIDQIKHKLKSIPRKRVLKWAGILTGSVVIFILFFIFLVYAGAFGKLPSKSELREIKQPVASIVFAADSSILGKYFIENRNTLRYDEIPDGLVKALVSTEDIRFYKHRGIDFRALMRVVFRSLLMGDKSGGGGSTLTQQLAKNLMGRPDDSGIFKMIVVKIRENIVARRLENIYTKEEILTLYLNTVNFGGTVFGLKTASRTYFNSDPEDLNLQQSATLVGMLKATTSYNPLTNQERAKDRRNTVLGQMQKYKYLTEAELDSLSLLPIELDFKSDEGSAGLAPYLREKLRIEIPGIIKDLQHPEGRKYNLYKDGLRIYTTIDPKLQRYAEEAVTEHMKELQKTFENSYGENPPWENPVLIKRAMLSSARYKNYVEAGISDDGIDSLFQIHRPTRVFTYEGEKVFNFSAYDSLSYYLKFLEPAFMVTDPATGDIKATVGGINHKFIQLDHTQVKRQVGSVFKPIVFLAALEQGLDPCQYTDNDLVTYPEYENWTPQNADGEYGGKYSFAGILAGSVNVPTVKVALETGVGNINSMAKRLGFESELPGSPAVALGAADGSLYELMQVYSSIASRGKVIPQAYLLRIEDSQGRILFEREIPEEKWVVKSAYVRQITEMLRGVVNHGTAAELKYKHQLYSIDIAGKTGTSQNNSDGWFIGFTPDLLAGVWVGGALPEIRFRSTRMGAGAKTALPIWGIFFNKLLSDPDFERMKNKNFSPLPEDLAEALDCDPIFYNMEDSWFFNLFGRNNDPSDSTSVDTSGGRFGDKIKESFRKIFNKKEEEKTEN